MTAPPHPSSRCKTQQHSSRYDAKLADFGFAKALEQGNNVCYWRYFCGYLTPASSLSLSLSLSLSTRTAFMDALQECLQGVDLQERLIGSVRCIGEQILCFLPKTFVIVQSTHDAFPRDLILQFARKGYSDDDIPFTLTKLKFIIEEGFADMFLVAQERFLAVSFEKKEHKFLTATDSVPFIHKGHDALHVRRGLFGEVTCVYEGSDVYALKRMEICDRSKEEYELLRYLPEHPHLLSLRASYIQEKNHFLVLSPWCQHTLSTFYTFRDSLKWWREVGDPVYFLVKWMHCLACALAVLHSYKVKHMDLKPDNLGLYEEQTTGGNAIVPVLLNYGCSKRFTVEVVSKGSCCWCILKIDVILGMLIIPVQKSQQRDQKAGKEMCSV